MSHKIFSVAYLTTILPSDRTHFCCWCVGHPASPETTTLELRGLQENMNDNVANDDVLREFSTVFTNEKAGMQNVDKVNQTLVWWLFESPTGLRMLWLYAGKLGRHCRIESNE